MKKIFTAPIHRLSIKSLNITENSFKLETTSTVLKKNAYFYRNIFNKIISFDYSTRLATKEEADDYLIYSINANKNKDSLSNNSTDILYFDEDELTFEKEIKNKELKLMKKQYKK